MAPFFIVWPLRKAQGDAEAFSMAIILQRGGGAPVINEWHSCTNVNTNTAWIKNLFLTNMPPGGCKKPPMKKELGSTFQLIGPAFQSTAYTYEFTLTLMKKVWSLTPMKKILTLIH